MHEILNALDYYNFGSLLIILLLLRYVAQLVEVDRPDIRRWSRRLAAAAMFGHAVLLWVDWKPTIAPDIAGIIFRSLITGAFALLISKIVLSSACSLYSFTLHPPIAAVERLRRQRQRDAECRHRKRLEDERRLAEQREWERQAPARERARRLAEQRERQARADQKRREQSRLDCELFYALYAPEIQGRFSPTEFAQFVHRYMRDDMHPEAVAGRGKQLQQIIKQHADKCDPPPKFNSLSDVSAWYEQQTLQAATINDERLQRLVVAQLKARYADLTTQILEEVQR